MVGEPSDVKAGGLAPAEDNEATWVDRDDGTIPAVGEQPRGRWIGRHWRGELPLFDAFWINGVLVNIAFSILGWGENRLMGDDPHWLWVFIAVPMAVLMVPLTVWQVVGVWRSASHFPGRRLLDGRHVGRRLWSVTARVVALIWFVEMLAVVVGFFG